jgi:hypothetical protein
VTVKFSSIALDLTLFRILDFEVRFLYCALPWSLLQLARCDDFYQKAAWLYIGLWSNMEEAAQGKRQKRHCSNTRSWQRTQEKAAVG